MPALLRRLLLLSAFVLLAGCGGSSSPSGSPDTGGETPPPTGRSFEGRAVKGVVQYGVVEVHEFLAGEWQSVSTGTPVFTDAEGLFELDLSGTSGPVRITITADHQTQILCDALDGCGDNDFGDPMDPPTDFRLITMVPSSRAGGQIAVTPLTHLAASWIESLPAGLPVTDSLIALTQSRVADLFGLAEDFAWQLPIDITDDNERNGAANMLHELLGASFSAIAYGQGIDLQALIEAYAGEFSGLAGQLLVYTDHEAMRPGLDLLHELTLAAVQVLVDESVRESLIASINNLIDRWGDNPVSSAGGVVSFDQQEFDSALVLLDDLHRYLGMAGIDESGNFLSTQMAQVQWLYDSHTAKVDTVGLLRVVTESVVFALIGSMSDLLLESLDEETRAYLIETNCIDLSMVDQLAGMDLPADYATYCLAERTLSVVGVRHNQLVNVGIDVAPLQLNQPMQFALRGVDTAQATATNSTATGALAGTLSVTIAGDIPQSIGDLLGLSVGVALAGSGSLVPTAGGDGFQVSLDAAGSLDLEGITSGAPILTLQVNDGELTSPFGDQLWAITDSSFCADRQPMLLALGDTSTLQACFGFEAFGLPEMHMTLAGSLSGLFDFIGQALAGLGNFSGDFSSLLDGLDPSSLLLLGDARLKVLDPEGVRVYAFSLDNNRLDATLEGSDHGLSFYATSLDGGYIFSGSTLVATVHSDWQNLGATIKFVDGRDDRVYRFGRLTDVVDEDLIQFLLLALAGVLESLSGVELTP